MYIGIDVHRKRSQVAVLNDHGDEVLNRNVLNDPATLLPLLGRFPTGTPVVFEAAYGWGWLVELLDETGFEVHMAHAGRCKAIASARLKNDRVDARTLAHLLRTQMLAEAWIAPKEIRDLRALLRHRTALVRMRTTLTIRAQVKPDPRAQALQALPGIGPLIGLTLLAEIGTITRFPAARKLCAWTGLTPTVRNSDRKVRHGGISKQGSVWVRAALGKAAQKARLHPLFRRSYATIARRRGRNIATVAIARKLLARCFQVLKDLEAARTARPEKVSEPVRSFPELRLRNGRQLD